MSHKRIDEINATLKAIQPGWPFFMAAVGARIETLTESLITTNNEETRGRIKALRDLQYLPGELEAERDGMLAAELPDPGSAL